MKAILTRYVPATNTKAARIEAYDSDDNYATVPYDGGEDAHLSDEDAHRRACEALKAKMGWTGEMIGGGTEIGMAWVFLP